jgi:hypothetical protein
MGVNTDLSKVKLLETNKGLLISQNKNAAVSVNPQKLSEAIAAYNAILENSSPDAVVTISKLDQFMVIAQTLRQLRSSIM